MSYNFVCFVVKSTGITPPPQCQTKSIGAGITLVWMPDANRNVTTESIGLIVSDLTRQCSELLVIEYDDGVGMRQATKYEAGHAVRGFGESDEQWIPIDDNGLAVVGAIPISPDEMNDDLEYDCVRCGIAAALENFLGHTCLTVSQIREAICSGPRSE